MRDLETTALLRPPGGLSETASSAGGSSLLTRLGSIPYGVYEFQRVLGLFHIVDPDDMHILEGRSGHGCLGACLAALVPVSQYFGDERLP